MTRRRLAAAALAAAGTLLLAWAGARWWRSRQPRPDLLAFAPPDAVCLVQARDGARALARLKAVDAGGALLGPAGVLTRALAAVTGPGFPLDLIAELARDEALFAGRADGRFLAVFRPGARERLADRLAAGTRLVRRRRVPGGTLRLVALPGGGRLAYAVVRGAILVSTREDMVAAALAGNAGAPPAAARLAALLPANYSLRVSWLGPLPRPLTAVAAQVSATRGRATLAGRALLDPASPAASHWADAAARTPPRVLTGLQRLPAGALAAAAAASAAWLNESSATSAAWRWLTVNAPPGADPAALVLAAALLDVDHRGIVPMPQLAAVATDGAGWLDPHALLQARAELGGISHGELRLDSLPPDAGTGWIVNFPVTRTLAPLAAVRGADAVAASSLAALDRLDAVRARREPSLADAYPRTFGAPAHAAAFLDAAGVAAEAERIVAGLREYELISPGTDRRWTAVAPGWLRAAGIVGRVAVAARFEAGGITLSGEAGPD